MNFLHSGISAIWMKMDRVQISAKNSRSDTLLNVGLILIRIMSDGTHQAVATYPQDLCEEIAEFSDSFIHCNYMLLDFLRASDFR